MTTKTIPDRQTFFLIAGAAEVDVATVKRFYRGEPLRQVSRKRIERALAALAKLDLCDVPKTMA